MNKLLHDHIDRLLCLYDQAQTTDEQEAWLADFFRDATDIPEAWQRYAILFRSLDMLSEELKAKNEEDLLPHPSPFTLHPSPFTLHSSLRKIAAVFIGVLLLSGIAFAAFHFARQSQPTAEGSVTEVKPQLSTLNSQLPSSLRFDDVRLDSILTVVAAHYNKAVSFRDEEPRSMKFITTWNPDKPLQTFIDHLNMFDYLRLTLQHDTIFVEQTSGEDGK